MGLLEQIFGGQWIIDLFNPYHAKDGRFDTKGGHSGSSRVTGETPKSPAASKGTEYNNGVTPPTKPPKGWQEVQTNNPTRRCPIFG